jgi:hypothetical protein
MPENVLLGKIANNVDKRGFNFHWNGDSGR